MDGHGINLSRTVSNKALLHPCVPYYPLRAMEHHFLAKCCLAFFGGDAKSLAWVFLARRVLPFVFFFLPFLGAMPNPSLGSLGCFLLVGCCLSCLGSFVAFFLGRCQIPRLGVSCSSGAAFRVCFFHVVFSTKWTPCISLLNGFGVLVERCWSRNLCSNEYLY